VFCLFIYLDLFFVKSLPWPLDIDGLNIYFNRIILCVKMSCVNKALKCIHFFNYWLFCRLIQTGETLQCSRPCHKLHIQFTKLNFLVSISSTLNSHVFHMNFFFLVTFGFEQTFVQKICAFNIDEIDDWYRMSNRFISIQSNYVSLLFFCVFDVI